MKQLSDRIGRMFGDRSFYREFMIVALPMAFQQLIATSLAFVDGLMVGKLGEQAIAGVSVSSKYFFILQIALIAITGGLGAFISQYYGAEDPEKSQGLFMITVFSSLIVAGLFVAVIALFPRILLSLFVADPLTINAGLDYLMFIRFSFLPLAISLAGASALRAIGQTRLPMLIGALVICMNTGLNYLLIFGSLGFPKLGVRGAGLATLIARSVEVLLYIALLAPGRLYFSLRIKPIRILTSAIIKQVVRKTSQLTLNEMLWAIGITTLFWTYSQLTEKFIPSISIAETTTSFIYIILNGLATAISVQVGARLGASKFAEARLNAKRIIILGMLLCMLFGVLVFILSDKIPLLFNVSDEIRAMASTMLRVQVLFYALHSMNTTIFFLLRIGGDTQGTLLMDATFVWVLMIPLAVLLSLVIKPSMILLFLFIQGLEVYKIPMTLYLFRRGRWIVNLT